MVSMKERRLGVELTAPSSCLLGRGSREDAACAFSKGLCGRKMGGTTLAGEDIPASKKEKIVCIRVLRQNQCPERLWSLCPGR